MMLFSSHHGYKKEPETEKKHIIMNVYCLLLVWWRELCSDLNVFHFHSHNRLLQQKNDYREAFQIKTKTISQHECNKGMEDARNNLGFRK